jgi:hypothetical protein
MTFLRAQIALLLLLVLCLAAPAGAISILPVSGTIRSGQPWTINLTGDRGFSLNGFFIGGPEGTFVTPFPVPQGQPIDLGMGSLVIHGSMTLDGLTFTTDGSCGFPPFSMRCGVAGPLFIHAPTLAPITNPPLTGQLVTIAAPITNTFLMSLAFASDLETVNLVLAGPGQAVVTLRDFGSDELAHTWFPQSGVWQLDPVPEPATLLLWGTSAAGLALVRWYRRTHAHAA